VTFVLIRRVIYVVAVRLMLLSAIATEIFAVRGPVPFSYIMAMQSGVIATLLWCIVFLRVEPGLARGALGLLVVILLMFLFVYRLGSGSSNQTMQPTAGRRTASLSND
jgi:hypothetical protein